MSGMPATADLNGFNPAAGISASLGDLSGGPTSNTGGDLRTGGKTAGTLVFGNQSNGSNTMLYVGAALAALWIFKGKK